MFWLSIFVSTAVLSLAVGYVFGQKALSGVSSPVNSAGQLQGSVEFRDPRTIPLVNEKAIISGSAQILAAATPTPTPRPTPTPVVVTTPTPTETPSQSPQLEPTPSPEPLAQQTTSPELLPNAATYTRPPEPVAYAPPPTPVPAPVGGGVTLQVLSAQRQGTQIVLSVAMQNNSSEAVQFLYSFMNVTDDQGRSLTANAQGLPGQLPANGQVFQGTVRVSADTFSNAQFLSLSLSDYPNRRYQLVVPNIPIQ
jgi:hypothetical protein